MFYEDDSSTVVVFSHPNHELAIFGLLQRLRPHLVYLTDGGGEERVEQTRQGLRSIDLLDQAHFLNYPEQSFYESLLACDLAFYEGVASQLDAVLQNIRPRQILCDAIEFYNPVHDMSLPIVRAVLRGSAATTVFEVPLIYQKPAESEAYELQRMPSSRCGGQIEWQLSQRELAAKADARDRIYTILVDRLGPLILELPHDQFALEVIAVANAFLPTPGIETALRYERRAQLLMDQGEIDQKITYAGHYLPIATSLWGLNNGAPHANDLS